MQELAVDESARLLRFASARVSADPSLLAVSVARLSMLLLHGLSWPERQLAAAP